jgi:intracellular septation protein A/isopentenyldiphosphate isomerase
MMRAACVSSSVMNLSRILKSLLPSFIPLIAYVLVDTFLGERIGLYAGIGIGVVEFVVVLIRDRKPDPFVAADTLLLALAGAISLISDNDIWFKLKPAVIELVFSASFALLLVLPERYLKAYMERQLKGFEFPDSTLPAMRKSLGAMLAILAVHAGLTAWSAVALSTKAWGFVSGVFLYLLFGVFALAEFVYARVKGRRMRDAAGAARGEALLPVVDETGKVTGQAPERLCHSGSFTAVDGASASGAPARAGQAPGDAVSVNASGDDGAGAAAGIPGGASGQHLLHPAYRLFVVDDGGRLFLRRAGEPAAGGADPDGAASSAGAAPAAPWDVALSRHVEVGEGLEAAIMRGIREGLGVTAMNLEAAKTKPQPSLRYRRDDETESELVFVFFLPFAGPFSLAGHEGAEGRFFTPGEIAEAARAGLLSRRFLDEYRMLAEASRAGQANGA